MSVGIMILFAVLVVIIIIAITVFTVSNTSQPTPAIQTPNTQQPVVQPMPVTPVVPTDTTPNTKTLYTSYYDGPGRYLIGWTDFTTGMKQNVKTLTNALAGTTQYTACKSTDAPLRYVVKAGNTCPTGYVPDMQFYGYTFEQPNTVPVCLGDAQNPYRGKIGIGETDCNLYGWTHTGLFYEPA